MRAVGLVGHGSDKFTSAGEERARALIRSLLIGADAMVSGHSPVGGIDIWSEVEAKRLGVALDLKIPAVNAWNPPGSYGFKARNIDIAMSSTEVHVILVDSYPPGYQGRHFDKCYHCLALRPDLVHVKSGGCWTGNWALRIGTPATWHVVGNAA